MNGAATAGFLGVGAVATAFGLICMYVWKCTPTIATWLMGIGGVCLAVASWKPLKMASDWVLDGSESVGTWLGVGSVGLIVAVFLFIHGVRTMHPKKGPKAKKSAAWAAFFAPAAIGALGGFLAVASKLGDMFHQIGDGVSAWMGGS